MGVSTCILGFHDFQASILENAGTCCITVMYWYCPHMHVVILDCLKANWPKFSCLTHVSLSELQMISMLSLSMRLYMYVTVTSKWEIITTHHCRDVEVIRVQEMYVDHWKVKDAPGVMKYTVYYTGFFCGVLFYMKFCSFFFFIFNSRNCLIYNFGFIF